MIAARRGWFDGYAWIVRANLDVRFEDTSFLAAVMQTSTAVLERCCPRNTSHPAICTDFFAARPTAMNHSWAHGPQLRGRVHNEWAAALVFQRVVDDGTATVWDIEEAYRTQGCRVGGRGIYHDHAYCAGLPAEAPPAAAGPALISGRRTLLYASADYLTAPSHRFFAVGRFCAVFLVSFATVRLLCSTRRATAHEQ